MLLSGLTKKQPLVDWILTPGEDKQEYFVQKDLDYAYLLDENNLGGCRQVSFLSTLVRLGYLDDPRVKRMIEVFVEKGRFDGAICVNGRKAIIKVRSRKAALPQLFRHYIYIPYCRRVIMEVKLW